MKRIIAATAIALSLAAGLFAGRTWWTHRAGATGASAHAGTVYTCPMHPDYRSDHPGDCPICGMRLKADRGSGTAGGAAASRAFPDGAVHVTPSGSRRSASDSASSVAWPAPVCCGQPGAWRPTRTGPIRLSPA